MRQRLRLLSCLPVLVALSAAGSGVTAGPVTLTGRVADAQGRPLGGAEVWITRNAAAAERVAVTAADGRFEVPGLSRYQFVLLDVCRDGYFFAQTELEDVSPDLLPVTLEPAGSLSGRLHGPDGPLAGKSVRARRDGVLKMQETVSACRTGEEWVRTDSQGRFTIGPLRPGLYWLDAEVNGYRLHRLGYLPVSAKKRELDVALDRGDVVLTGRVTDTEGQPVPGIEIVGRNDELVRITTSESGPDGVYRITGLEPGKGSVRIGGDLRHEKEMVFVHGENRMDFIILPSSPDYPVRGRVREPSGQPVAWAHVHFSDLRPGTERLPSPHFATVTRADGTFEIRLPVGPYEVEAWKPGFFPVHRPGSLTIEDHAPDDLDLRMPPGAVLTGRLLGVPRGKVAEIEARGPLPPSGEVDEKALYRLPFGENRFRLPQGENLPGGTYRISDLGPGTWEIEAEIPGSLVETKREARGRVTIPPGAVRAHLDLDFGAPQ
jgi:Carboxypeptidase regulatory-like domain